ncbi:MAG: NYN domain-containing protein [bacterium]|nr:NYN domain-containing protein [bacterium]
MDRYAIFVDAGYVYAAGGELCCGTKSRKQFELDVPELRDHLNGIALRATGLSALRMYWYDAAPYDGPTPEHRTIASLANIKLRLGRIKSYRQKGVDALIYHDLVNLARERAISDAFLVSGDEDLREGVRTVQGFGVRVTLIGIPPIHQATNQSLELIQEADELVTLTKDDLSSLFHLKSPTADSQHRVAPTENTAPASSTATPCMSDEAIAREAGSVLAGTLQDSPDLEVVIRSRPRIPAETDRQLLRSLRQELGNSDVPEKLKREARASFWRTLARLTR